MSFTKTVIPVAGLGTRFLPATKAQPKEMLTIIDRPLIQYAVEEAVAAGSDQIVLVSAPGKESIIEHFRPAPELESLLAKRGKTDAVGLVHAAGHLARVEAVMQDVPLGVGHAILQAREKVGDEPFGVMFPDDVIIAQVPVMEQLRRVHARHGGIVVAVERVPHEHVDRYGVISGEPVEDGVYRVADMVEKPPLDEAPTDLAIVGRYVLPGQIFSILAHTNAGIGGEIQITDAMRTAIGSLPCHAVIFEGERHDCGSKLGFLQATMALSRRHPELASAFD